MDAFQIASGLACGFVECEMQAEPWYTKYPGFSRNVFGEMLLTPPPWLRQRRLERWLVKLIVMRLEPDYVFSELDYCPLSCDWSELLSIPRSVGGFHATRTTKEAAEGPRD